MDFFSPIMESDVGLDLLSGPAKAKQSVIFFCFSDFLHALLAFTE